MKKKFDRIKENLYLCRKKQTVVYIEPIGGNKITNKLPIDTCQADTMNSLCRLCHRALVTPYCTKQTLLLPWFSLNSL